MTFIQLVWLAVRFKLCEMHFYKLSLNQARSTSSIITMRCHIESLLCSLTTFLYFYRWLLHLKSMEIMNCCAHSSATVICTIESFRSINKSKYLHTLCKSRDHLLLSVSKRHLLYIVWVKQWLILSCIDVLSVSTKLHSAIDSKLHMTYLVIWVKMTLAIL